MLQVENVFHLQVIGEGNDSQLNLKWVTLDEKKNGEKLAGPRNNSGPFPFCNCRAGQTRNNPDPWNERTFIMSMVTTHVSYLVISVSVTIWVARTLRKHGMIYLSDKMDSKPEVAESFSNLLIVGFYLVNLGFESLALKYGGAAHDTVSAIELLSTKIGFVLLCLGAMHFITVAVLTKSRRSVVAPPPAAPAYLR